MKLYSEVGVGTSVKIYLPRHGTPAPDETVEATQHPPPGRASEAIIAVEDEDRVRAVSADALRELGYTVIEAADAAKALKIVENGRRLSLLFTDVVVPGLSGRELVDRLRAMGIDVPVLYTTGYTHNAIVPNGILEPRTQLLTKPFTIEDLANKVGTILDRKVSKGTE